MKLNGFVGKGSGRLGSSVFTVRGGEQIVREYTPNVANPNTDAQKAQRAKFKLLSQVAAIAANALLFPKVGNVSRRNAFVAANMPATTYSEGAAALLVENMSLGLGHEPITASRTDVPENNVVNVVIQNEGYDGFVYATFDMIDNGRIIGISGSFDESEGNVPVISARMSRTAIVVAAYRFRDSAVRAKYGDIVSGQGALAPSQIALRITELVAMGDIIVSQTVVAM